MPTTPSDSQRDFRRWILVAALLALGLALLVRGCTSRVSEAAPRLVAEDRPAPAVAPPVSPAVPGSSSETAANDGYRMRALTFTMDASGVRLEQAVEAVGRVKAPPVSIAPNRLEFEVYGRGGEKLYAGSLDHPLHRIYEYEDPDRAGNLRHVAHDVASDGFQVRLPATLPATRIDFFEVRAGLDTSVRTPLGTISLP